MLESRVARSPRASGEVISTETIATTPAIVAPIRRLIVTRLKHLRYSPMLAIVRIALSRPYTFIVAGLLILLIGTLAAVRMPVDIFPSIDIPIIGVGPGSTKACRPTRWPGVSLPRSSAR